MTQTVFQMFLIWCVVYPFKLRHENAYSLYCSPHIPYGTSKENLSKLQGILSLAITFFILIALKF